MTRSFFVYILASRSRRLYVGVTRDLVRRVHEHRTKVVDGFTARYRIDRLVHFEETGYLQAAIAREKEIKGWRREKKLALVEASNPPWNDLGRDWYDGTGTADPPLRSERGGLSADASFTAAECSDRSAPHSGNSRSHCSARKT